MAEQVDPLKVVDVAIGRAREGAASLVVRARQAGQTALNLGSGPDLGERLAEEHQARSNYESRIIHRLKTQARIDRHSNVIKLIIDDWYEQPDSTADDVDQIYRSAIARAAYRLYQDDISIEQLTLEDDQLDLVREVLPEDNADSQAAG